MSARYRRHKRQRYKDRKATEMAEGGNVPSLGHLRRVRPTALLRSGRAVVVSSTGAAYRFSDCTPVKGSEFVVRPLALSEGAFLRARSFDRRSGE